MLYFILSCFPLLHCHGLSGFDPESAPNGHLASGKRAGFLIEACRPRSLRRIIDDRNILSTIPNLHLIAIRQAFEGKGVDGGRNGRSRGEERPPAIAFERLGLRIHEYLPGKRHLLHGRGLQPQGRPRRDGERAQRTIVIVEPRLPCGGFSVINDRRIAGAIPQLRLIAIREIADDLLNAVFGIRERRKVDSEQSPRTSGFNRCSPRCRFRRRRLKGRFFSAKMLDVFGEMREVRGRAVLLFGSPKWQGRFPGGAPCGLAEMGFSGGIGKVVVVDNFGSAAKPRWIGG